jgi:SAM-dependent methyltransferase
MAKTEFFETAVKRGFYGIDKSGLFGKKDNVRKYWEDVSIKVSVRDAIEQILEKKQNIRVMDLGCGSGEGVELLTHIPFAASVNSTDKEFLITENNIELYHGVDISPAMVEQGRKNYSGREQIQFSQADLSRGLPFMESAPYDIYFSSYASQSHLAYSELMRLTQDVFSHIDDVGYMVFDLYGRFSPEWPTYWNKNCHEFNRYTMAYLLPFEQQDPQKITWFDATFWSSSELKILIESAAAVAGRKIRILSLKDRSTLIGRHMDTILFKKTHNQPRLAVNRLFDRDYRGQIGGLKLDLNYLDEVKDVNPSAWQRIYEYHQQWKKVVEILDALMKSDNTEVRRIIESSPENLAAELKMLAWVYRNADRFPVVDFWASIMGPQVACVLRNLELSLPEGLGCGHGLFCVVEVKA